MISSIRIEGYRGLRDFKMPGLGRINLLVGTNNSGKTSVLEAIHLLTSSGDPLSLWQVLNRRGERSLPPSVEMESQSRRRRYQELDVSHLFTGHDCHPGARISLSAEGPGGAAPIASQSLSYSVSELTGKEQADLFGLDEDVRPGSRLGLQINGNPKPNFPLIPLGPTGGLSLEVFDIFSSRSRKRITEVGPSLFVTTESLTIVDLARMWNRVALQPTEQLVLRSLQFLEPRIERIASQVALEGEPLYFGHQRGGFILKLRGAEQPVPIGSMGDGMWRMLAMAIALSQTKGGVLLVDEIDTGLHYSVMEKMWQLVAEAARELDIQVFATTHSFDCVYSLATVCEDDKNNRDLTVQRIESGKAHSIAYTQEEIAVAAERRVEVR